MLSIVRAMRERFLKLYHGDPMSISTANHIYGELRKRGYSVRNWAIERGLCELCFGEFPEIYYLLSILLDVFVKSDECIAFLGIFQF